MRAVIAAIAVAVALPVSAQEAEPRHGLVLTGAGRFAVLADLATIRGEDDARLMRAFQVVEPDFTAGGQNYWGGWSWWRFDCAATTADRLDFASVREGGGEGPATPDDQPAHDAAPGGDAAELLNLACGTGVRAPDVTTLEDAVILGRAVLAGEPDQPR